MPKSHHASVRGNAIVSRALREGALGRPAILTACALLALSATDARAQDWAPAAARASAGEKATLKLVAQQCGAAARAEEASVSLLRPRRFFSRSSHLMGSMKT